GTGDPVPGGGVAAPAVAGQRRARAEVFAPIDASDSLVDALRTAGVDRSQAQQHAGRRTRPEAGAIAHLQRALKFHIVAALANVVGAELRQLLGQHRSGAHGRGCDPVAHIVIRLRTEPLLVQNGRPCDWPPMHMSRGRERMKLMRDARAAVLRAAAFSSSVAGISPRIFFWFGQMKTQTLNSIMVPSHAPTPIVRNPGRSMNAHSIPLIWPNPTTK